jgi:hypothetical protein
MTATALYLFIVVFVGHGSNQVEIGPLNYEECTKVAANAVNHGNAWLVIREHPQEVFGVIEARCEPWPFSADEHWD